MDRVPCFLLTPTDRIRRSLRRYVGASSCPSFGYHNALATLDEVPVLWASEDDDDGDRRAFNAGSTHRRAIQNIYDPDAFDVSRYPTACPCGYAFVDRDTRQVFVELIYRAPDGREMTLRDAPAGAMWDADWMGHRYRSKDDGVTLVVKLPDGVEWCVDGPSSNGPGWTRAGALPAVVARPSIQTPGYHGFLGGADGASPGVLVSC